MAAQSQYWQQFVDMKRDAIYISHYHSTEENVERWVNMLSAIASSGSIAAWAIWQTASLLWGAIIATSQVITAIKPYLPYRTRLKALSSLGVELEALAITAESDWFKVSQGHLTEGEIHDLTMNLKRACLSATSKHFAGTSLPDKKGLLDQADRETSLYMERFRS